MRLHGNSFQRNLWSGTLLFGLRITATTEKWADCRNTNGFKNHSTCKLGLFPEQLMQNVHAVYSILPFCIEDYRPPEETSVCSRRSYSIYTCLQQIHDIIPTSKMTDIYTNQSYLLYNTNGFHMTHFSFMPRVR